MSMIQKIFDAWDAKDKSAVASIVHDEFVMTSHAQGGKNDKAGYVRLVRRTST